MSHHTEWYKRLVKRAERIANAGGLDHWGAVSLQLLRPGCVQFNTQDGGCWHVTVPQELDERLALDHALTVMEATCFRKGLNGGRGEP